MRTESLLFGYALRRHNAVEDWASMRYDLSLQRSGAVVHL